MKTTILKMVRRFAGFAGLFLIALIISPLVVRSVNAQNKAAGMGAGKKAAASKKAGKKSKNKKKGKDKEMQDDDEPKIVKLPPRTGEFNPGTPISKTAREFGITPPLRDMPEVMNPSGIAFDGMPVIEDEENNEVQVERTIDGAVLGNKPFTDPLAFLSRRSSSLLSPQAMPGPSLVFNGILSTDNIAAFGTTSMPPDTVGDVGPNHYVQSVNFGVFRVYNKSGVPLTALARISAIFSSLAANSPCRTGDNGDPVVNYDPLADRWLISQFYTRNPLYGQCIAVSQTGDPTGAWYAYDFPSPDGNFADYPHWAVWTDGYYLATHEFNAAGTTYVTGGFYAFNRNRMLVGDPNANFIYFKDPSSFGHLPADIDGYLPPPAGTSQYFFEYDSAVFTGGSNRLLIHELIPDYTTPANSTFTIKSVPIAAHDPRNPTGRADIEQPVVPATSYLDAISNNSMYRVAYRNLGTAAVPVNSYVTNWTVNVSGVDPTTSAALYQAAIRWEEVRRDGAGVLSIFDQGTHAPDPVSGTGRNRWMGSIAQDYLGNIALGFSRSGIGTPDFPDIVWAGRTGGQTAAGTLNEGEATMKASTGYQNANNNRWGDYSAMVVDPTDDCTFWYTNEWRDAAFNGTANSDPFKWSTSIGNFKFPGCTAAPKGQIAANVTYCDTGLPINGAAVIAQAGGFLRTTNASGNLITNIIAAPGNYTVSAFKKGLTTSTTQNVTVTNGGVITANICLGGGFPIVELASTPAPVPVDENANGRLDPGETATLSIPLKNTGGLEATAVSATLTTTTPGVTILPPQTLPYPDLARDGGMGSSAMPFRFKLDSSFVCGNPISFTLSVNYNGTTAAQTLNFTVTTLSPVSVSTTLDTTAPPSNLEYTATTGTQTGRLTRNGIISSCAAPKATPGLQDSVAGRRYDAYIFTASTAGCITVTVTPSNATALYSAAYGAGGYVPTAIMTNYLADYGVTTAGTISYSFNVTAGQQFTVVVHEITAGAGIGVNYTLSLSGPIARTCQTFIAPFEADVAGRPNGSGDIQSNDVVQMLRFLNELDTPSTASTEFQRADSAPRATRGDGKIEAADVVQTIRYLNELDTLQSTGGPTAPPPPPGLSSAAETAVSGKSLIKQSGTASAPQVAPELRVESTSGSAGNPVTVNIRVDALGNESQYGFAVLFDPAVLSFANFAAGETGAATFSCNTTATAGRVKCDVGGFPNNNPNSNNTTIREIGAGNNQLLIKVIFNVSANAVANTMTAVSLGSASASDDAANSITPATTNGTVTITGATAAGATVAGRVTTASGRGIRGASVKLTDSEGNIRTAVTTAFGYYRFEDIPSGQTYVISVKAKRFTFGQATQVLNLNADDDSINFVAN